MTLVCAETPNERRQRIELLEEELEGAFSEVREVLKNSQAYKRWRMAMDMRLSGLPILIPTLTDAVRKVASMMRTDQVYLQRTYELYGDVRTNEEVYLREISDLT